MKRPNDISYWLNDRPPFTKIVFLGLQQVFLVAIYMVLVNFIAQTAHTSSAITSSMISISFIVMGVAVMLQASRWGAGYLLTNCPAVTYLTPSLAAALAGGLPLVFGMTIFAGCCEALFSRIVKRLRLLFPPVVTGLTFCGLGLSVGIMSIKHLIGNVSQLNTPGFSHKLIAFCITLIIMLALSVWAKGFLKLLCLMLGLIIGSILSYFLGLFTTTGLTHLHQAALFAIPQLSYLSFSFSWSLAPVFLIAAIAAGLRSYGTIITSQQINDAEWTSVDYASTKRGIFTDGLFVALSGLFGTSAIGLSPSATGATKASGATSRIISIAVGLICILFGFLPKISAFFIALPSAVVSAGLIITASIMFAGGLRLIGTQPLDIRRTYIIGISLLVALSPIIFPDFFKLLPMIMQEIFKSTLATIAFSAIILNLIFHIGRRKTVKIIENQYTTEKLNSRLIDLGINKVHALHVAEILNILINNIINQELNEDPVNLKLSYDEVTLTSLLSYQGQLPQFDKPDRKNLDRYVEDMVAMQGIQDSYKIAAPQGTKCSSSGGYCSIEIKFTQV